MSVNLKNDDIEKKYKVGEGEGGGWIKLEEGDNRVRIVTEIEDYGSHYLPSGGSKKSQICIGSENGCPACSMNLRPSAKFLCYAIDRKDGELKLLNFGYTVFKQFKALSQDAEFGFDAIPDYDINIHKTGKGVETEYSIIPGRNATPLTIQEQDEIGKIKKTASEIIEAMKGKVDPIQIRDDLDVDNGIITPESMDAAIAEIPF